MKQGIITKGVGGFYDVLIDDEILRSRARGIFRKDNIMPMVGDRVMVSLKDESITEILPRKNQLIRPAIANIDVLGVVIAPIHPAPDFYLVDKLMVSGEKNNIENLLIINKIDLVDENAVKEISDIYKSTKYPIVELSCMESEGFEKLKELIEEKTVTLAGQSGVGKSSVINVLYPEQNLRVGELSDRIGRGRHTTRHTKLLPLDCGGMLVDTPGFSFMDIEELMPEELQYLYPDFLEYINECRFNGCVHDKEPGCSIKTAVSQGILNKDRYKRYIRLLEELREHRRNIW